MQTELILHDVIQNRSSIISHNIKAIAPRLDVVCGSNYIKATGWAVQDEINEIMDFVKQYHNGDHTLHTSWR